MPVFAALKAETGFLTEDPKSREPEFEWLELEECEALLGNVEVETFPMLLIGDGKDTLYFAGPVTPHLATLVRLIRSAAEGDLKVPDREAATWLSFFDQLHRR